MDIINVNSIKAEALLHTKHNPKDLDTGIYVSPNGDLLFKDLGDYVIISGEGRILSQNAAPVRVWKPIHLGFYAITTLRINEDRS